MVHKPPLYRPLSYGARTKYFSTDDSAQNFIIAFVLALIVLVVFFVIGIAIHHVHGKARAEPAAAVVPAMPGAPQIHKAQAPRP
jgi:hypothetical protein